MPSLGHQLETAKFVSTQAMHSVRLQWERSQREESDDNSWGGSAFRQEADLQYFLIALRRLRRVAARVEEITQDTDLSQGLEAFDAALPDVKRMRDVDEHIDEYLIGRGRDEAVPVGGLEVTIRRGSTLEWAGMTLDVDDAFHKAEELYAGLV